MSTRKRVRAAPPTPEERAEIDAILRETEGRPHRKQPVDQVEADRDSSMTNEAFHAMLGVIRQLKQEREKQGKTASEVARSAGIDPSMLSRLESGRVPNPTYETLSKIAAALGLSVHLSVSNETSQRPDAGGLVLDPLEQLVLDIARAIGPQKVIMYLATKDVLPAFARPDRSLAVQERETTVP